jgi:UDPglucose 6-dehydrogenase
LKPSISVIGLGYVGLCTAVSFASKGFPAHGVDIDREKINSLREGRSPIFEPQLKSHLTKTLKSGLFMPTVEVDAAVNKSDITFLSVGTPNLADGSIDLGNVKQSSKAIGAALAKKHRWHLVVVRSTVVPGTCDSLVRPEIEAASGKKCGRAWGLCMNPEFLKEGSAIRDTLRPDRIVIGEFDEKSGEALARLYRKFFQRNITTRRMSLVNAELVKYANNAFLAMKVSFANMIAGLCETLPSADVQAVTDAIGLDRRIGPEFLRAGLGYGGSCFPKDISALIMFARKQKNDLPLAHATVEINETQPLRAVTLGEKLAGDLSGKRVALLGLAFKPETDDMRDAVSIRIIRELLRRGARVVAYDPKAVKQARRIFAESITFADSAVDCIRDSDLCILVTEWDCFSDLKPRDFEKLMHNPVVVDGRRLFDACKFSRMKFAAIGLGSAQNS